MTGESPPADHSPDREQFHRREGSTTPEIEAKQQRYDHFVNRAELPMLVLSMLVVPVVLMPFLEDLSHESLYALEVLGVVLWAGFAVQYVLLLYLSPNRWRTVRENKLDLLLVLLPFLRPLRIVHLAHAGTALARVGRSVRQFVGRPEFGGTIATVGGFVVVSGVLVTIAEHDQPDSTISGLGDGIWWAIVTCTTVGYGDEFPATTTGRIVAVLLMLAGISGLSVITANIAAYFVSNDVEDEHEEVSDRLSRIEHKLELVAAQLELGLSTLEHGGWGGPDSPAQHPTRRRDDHADTERSPEAARRSSNR